MIHDDGLGLPFSRPADCLRQPVRVKAQLSSGVTRHRVRRDPANESGSLPARAPSCQRDAVRHELRCVRHDCSPGRKPSSAALGRTLWWFSPVIFLPPGMTGMAPSTTPLAADHLRNQQRFGLEKAAQDSRRLVVGKPTRRRSFLGFPGQNSSSKVNLSKVVEIPTACLPVSICIFMSLRLAWRVQQQPQTKWRATGRS